MPPENQPTQPVLLTASIVTYKNDSKVLQQAIGSFLNTRLPVKLYIIDNSPTDALRNLCRDARVTYVFNNQNLGFGKAHNIAIRKSMREKAPYHLVLNPDVFFESGTLEKICEYMEQHEEVGQLMPNVLYPDGKIQYLCKLLPSPLDFIKRRFVKKKRVLDKLNHTFELRFTGYRQIMNVPYLSGCFMFLRNAALREVGLFDERIFMYSEDADLTRRIHQKFKTVFFPEAKIYHHFAKGSHRNLKLLFYAIHGNVVYFTKWGWIFDRERKRINQTVLKNLQYEA